MNNKPNRDRIFNQILSVDAWRSAFGTGDNCASIHVDVSFLNAKLGQEPQSKVRFDICLKRAEVSIYIPETDPIKVVQSSVARERPLSGENRQSRLSGQLTNVSGSLDVSMNAHKPVNINANISKGNIDKITSSVVLEGTTSQFGCKQYNKNGSYCWEITPAISDRLVGKIWNPNSEPRMSIKYQGPIRSSIDIACRVMIKCRREDIIIENIDIKTKNIKELKQRFKENRLAAASACIKHILSSKDFNIDNFDEAYSEMLIADVLIDEETI